MQRKFNSCQSFIELVRNLFTPFKQTRSGDDALHCRIVDLYKRRTSWHAWQQKLHNNLNSIYFVTSSRQTSADKRDMKSISCLSQGRQLRVIGIKQTITGLCRRRMTFCVCARVLLAILFLSPDWLILPGFLFFCCIHV